MLLMGLLGAYLVVTAVLDERIAKGPLRMAMAAGGCHELPRVEAVGTSSQTVT